MNFDAVLIVFAALLFKAQFPLLGFAAVPTESVRWSFHPPGSAFFLRPRPDERHSGLTRRFYIHSADVQPELRAQLGPLRVARPALAAPPPTPAHVRPSVHVANPRSVVTEADPDVHYLCHIEVGSPPSDISSSSSSIAADYCCFVRTELPGRALRRKPVYSVCEVNRERKYCYTSAALPAQLWSPHATYYGPLRPSEQQVTASFVLLPRQRRAGAACGTEPPPLPLGASFRPVQGSPVWLVHGRSSATQGVAVVREDKDVLLIVPRRRVKPGENVKVSVKLVNNSNLVEFTLKVSIGRDHFTVIDAVVPAGGGSWPRHWFVNSKLNRHKQEAEVTARLMDKYFHLRPKKEQRIFDVIFRVRPTSQRKHNRVKVDWALLQSRYRDSQVRRSSAAHSFSTEINVGENSLINIVPILKDTNLINTAILDGKMVTYPLRIFALNRYYTVVEMPAGRCTCHSNEGAIVRVDRSCKFVYLDGREKYGGWNISLIVKYSQYTAYIHVHVWVPERHVRMELSDPVLNSVRAWRAPKHNTRRYLRMVDDFRTDGTGDFEGLPQSYFGRRQRTGSGSNGNGGARKGGRRRRLCGKVFQRTQVKVYTRFLTHIGSGRFHRRSSYRQRWRYLVDSNTWFDVTEMVSAQLGVDSSGWGPGESPVADVNGAWLIGRSRGRAMVKLSVKGVVIGNASFSVSQNKVRVTDLRVEPITALRTFISDDHTPGVGQVRLQPLNVVNSSRTDAFLHMRLSFSDGAELSLADGDLSDIPIEWEAEAPRDAVVIRSTRPSGRLWPRVQVIGGGGRTPEMTLWLQEYKSCRSRSRGRTIGPRTHLVIGGPQRRRKPKAKPPRPPLVPGPKLAPPEPASKEPPSRRRGQKAGGGKGKSLSWKAIVARKEEGKKKKKAEKKPPVDARPGQEEEVEEEGEEETPFKQPRPAVRPAATPARPSPIPPLARNTATPAMQTPVSPGNGLQEDEPGHGRRRQKGSRLFETERGAANKRPVLTGPVGSGRTGQLDGEEANASPTPLEIGMYVLLTIFCVAATVFAVNCGLMLARYQRRRMCRRTEAGKEGPCLSPVYEHGNLVGTREARNWVWLRPPGSGSSSEDKRPLSLASSQLPSHSVANASLPRSCISAAGVSSSSVAPAHARQERQSIAGLATFQHATVQPRHYQGDECSIRIVNNPMPIHVDDANTAPPATATAVSIAESKPRPSAAGAATFAAPGAQRHASASVASPSSTRSAPPPSFPPPPPPPPPPPVGLGSSGSGSGQPPAPPQRTTSCRAAPGAASRASIAALPSHRRAVATTGHRQTQHGAPLPRLHSLHGHHQPLQQAAPTGNNTSSGSGASSVASTMRGWDRHLRALPVEQRFAYFNNMKESVA